MLEIWFPIFKEGNLAIERLNPWSKAIAPTNREQNPGLFTLQRPLYLCIYVIWVSWLEMQVKNKIPSCDSSIKEKYLLVYNSFYFCKETAVDQ